MKILEYKAGASQVKLVWDASSKREEFFYKGSINHFWQVIMNVISNGIDAYEKVDTKKDRTVAISVVRQDESIIIKVHDSGGGIPPSKKDKIFEPFYSTKKGGIGVGLAITKRMIEKDFGGIIAVESKPKTGTVFTITIPYEARTSH